MNGTYCIRGCVYPGYHLRTCDEASAEGRLLHAIFGGRVKRCEGCQPVPTTAGSLLCRKDHERLVETLDLVPDLCAYLRSIVDPLRATAYDDAKGFGSKAVEAPAPLNLAALDAASEVVEIVAGWAKWFGSVETAMRLADGFPSWVGSEVAHLASKVAVDYLIENLIEGQHIAGDPMILDIYAVVCGYPPKSDQTKDSWTVRKALDRFPTADRSSWAKQPCPNESCGQRSVRVTPPNREGEPTRFRCKACGWSPVAAEADVWAEYFGLAVPV